MSNVPSTYDRIVAERDLAELPPDAPKVSRMRWSLLHGAAYTPAEAADIFGCSTSILSQITGDLRRAGYRIASEPVPSPDGLPGRDQSRFRIADLDHVPQPFEARQTKAAKAKATKAKATKPKPTPAAANGLRAFYDPAPPAPPLGTVLRVAMVAEDNGRAVVVLAAPSGARWSARVEESLPD